MVFFDMLGMNIEDGGVRFTPYLPEGISVLEVLELPIRGKTYDICVRGRGHEIQSFTVNGMRAEQFVAFDR